MLLNKKKNDHGVRSPVVLQCLANGASMGQSIGTLKPHQFLNALQDLLKREKKMGQSQHLELAKQRVKHNFEDFKSR